MPTNKTYEITSFEQLCNILNNENKPVCYWHFVAVLIITLPTWKSSENSIQN